MNAVQLGVLLLVAGGVTGCKNTNPELDALERCARALSLEAEASERMDRASLPDKTTLQPTYLFASRAYEAAARYSASACFQFPPDAFERSQKMPSPN